MEDAHTAVLDLLANNPEAAKAHQSRLSFFGVFDGHGGDKVALLAGDNIHNIIAKQETFKTGNYEQALKDGFPGHGPSNTKWYGYLAPVPVRILLPRVADTCSLFRV